MSKRYGFMTMVVAGMFGSGVAGCAASDGETLTLLPIIAHDDAGDAEQGLVGVYNSDTQMVWLTASTVDTAIDLAITEESAVDPRVVVMQGNSIDSPSSALSLDSNEAFLETGFAPSDLGRACVVDRDTNRWLITRFRVGTAGELARVSEEFVPSILAREDYNCYPCGEYICCEERI